jgi:hypothetical protein
VRNKGIFVRPDFMKFASSAPMTAALTRPPALRRERTRGAPRVAAMFGVGGVFVVRARETGGFRRRLLEHCFDEFGGGHESESGTSANGNNATALAALDGTNWEPVVTGVHADAVFVRLVYWLVFVAAAGLLLVFMLSVWPPPDRVFPRKKPVLNAVPWCCMGRMLGYGVIDWREGKLTPFFRYFKERHELISLFTGDMKFITFRSRVAHFVTGSACTASLSMGLVDLESGKVTGDFWLVQIWVFGALFVFEIVLGIALRVSAVGVSERALLSGSVSQQHKVEFTYFACCFAFALCCLTTSITFVHVMDEGGGCGDGLNTFLAYAYIFCMYELFSWFVFHPAAITGRWVLGRLLLKIAKDANTDEETMQCCWPKMICGCKPQPSAWVDSNGVASAQPHVFCDLELGDVELGDVNVAPSNEKIDALCSPALDEEANDLSRGNDDASIGDTPAKCASPVENNLTSTSTRRSHGGDQELLHSRVRLSAFRQSAAGTERELVLGWRRASASQKHASASYMAVRASVFRKDAVILRTALAEAQAAEAETEAASAAAEAAAASARAAAAEAKALRDALPSRRKHAPEMQPPTPQSIASSRGVSGASPFWFLSSGGKTPGTPLSTTLSSGYRRGVLFTRRTWPTQSPSPAPSSPLISRLGKTTGNSSDTPETHVGRDMERDGNGGDGGDGGGKGDEHA